MYKINQFSVTITAGFFDLIAIVNTFNREPIQSGFIYFHSAVEFNRCTMSASVTRCNTTEFFMSFYNATWESKISRFKGIIQDNESFGAARVDLIEHEQTTIFECLIKFGFMVDTASVNKAFNLIFLCNSTTIIEIESESFGNLSSEDIFPRTRWPEHIDGVTHCNLLQDSIEFRVQDFILHPVFCPIRQRDHVFNPLRNLICKNFSDGVINLLHHLIGDILFDTTEQTCKSGHWISEAGCTLGAGCTLCRCCR